MRKEMDVIRSHLDTILKIEEAKIDNQYYFYLSDYQKNLNIYKDLCHWFTEIKKNTTEPMKTYKI